MRRIRQSHTGARSTHSTVYADSITGKYDYWFWNSSLQQPRMRRSNMVVMPDSLYIFLKVILLWSPIQMTARNFLCDYVVFNIWQSVPSMYIKERLCDQSLFKLLASIQKWLLTSHLLILMPLLFCYCRWFSSLIASARRRQIWQHEWGKFVFLQQYPHDCFHFKKMTLEIAAW